MKAKRNISLALVVVMALTLGGAAVAVEATPVSYYSLGTEFDSILQSPNGSYAMVVDSENCLSVPVGKLDIELNDSEAVEELCEMDNVSDEVKEYIKELSERVISTPNNEDAVATLFSQDLLPQTRSTSYAYYNGMHMKNDQVYVYNISSPYILDVTGTTAKTAASSVYQISMFIGGLASPAVSLGGTLLSLFQTAYGTVTSATATDFTQVRVVYDGVSQWTYGKYDGVNWALGCASQRITIKQTEVFQQFVVNGVGRQQRKYTYPNTVIKPSYFEDPWSTAYYSLNSPRADWVTCKIRNSTFSF